MKLKKYLIFTFGISWICWGTLLFFDKLNILEYKSALGYTLAFIGVLAPTISSILLLEKRNIKNIINFIFSYKKKTWFYLIIFSIILILSYLLSSPINKELSAILYLPLFIYAITFGGGFEELGWRGILQPELEKRMSFPMATIFTGFIWSIWHLPLFFIEGTGQASENFLIFLFIGILMSFWTACIYKKTKSIFCCCVFHGLYNTLSAIFIISGTWSVIIGYACMTFLSIILYYKDVDK